MTSSFVWPNGKRLAVTVTVLLETWSDGKAPPYSVQTTSLKPNFVDRSGVSWGQYGGNEGIWRILRILDRFGVAGTLMPNAQSAKLYQKAIRAALAAGHEVAGHGNFQDQVLAYMEPDDEKALIQKSLAVLQEVTGQPIKGWGSPVTAWSEHTFGYLAEAGLKWHGEAKDFSMPRRIKTGSGNLIAIPCTDFSDQRVLKANPMDFYDVYRETFDYLYAHEPMSMIAIAVHAHWGGRPIMSAMLQKILSYYAQFPDIWFPQTSELADWIIAQDVDHLRYEDRFASDFKL